MKTRKQKTTVLKTALFAGGLIISASLFTACDSAEEGETTDGDPVVENDSTAIVDDTDTLLLDDQVDTFTVSDELIESTSEEIESTEL